MTELRVNSIKGENGVSSPEVDSNIVSSVNSTIQTLTCSTISVKNLTCVTGTVSSASLGISDVESSLTSATSSIGTLNSNLVTTTNLNIGGTSVQTKPPFATFAFGWDNETVYYEKLQNLFFGGYRSSSGEAKDGYQDTDAVDDVVNNGRFEYFTFGKAANNYRTPQRFQMLFKTLPPNNEYTVVVFGRQMPAQTSSWSCFHNSDDIPGFPSIAGGARLQERFTIQAPSSYTSNSFVAGMVFV